MVAKPLPSVEVLRQFLDYDAESGKLFWKKRTPQTMPNATPQTLGMWNARYAGTEAGYPDKRGYLRLRLHDVSYPTHRIAWKLVNGADPAGVIDHLNGNQSDNRLINLRSTSQADNTRNSSRLRNNTSGANGVSWDKRRGLWYATIKYDGKAYSIGHFETFNDAVVARKFAQKIFGFHPNHGLPKDLI